MTSVFSTTASSSPPASWTSTRHYDPQLNLGSARDTSRCTGVTTVAPAIGVLDLTCRADDQDYRRADVLARRGEDCTGARPIPWDRGRLGEYLASLEGSIAMNVGVRRPPPRCGRWVMGDAAFERRPRRWSWRHRACWRRRCRRCVGSLVSTAPTPGLSGPERVFSRLRAGTASLEHPEMRSLAD